MRRFVIAVVLVLLATAVFATARQDTKPAMPMMPGMMNGMMGNMMHNPPMFMPGVEITVTDTPDGVSVTYTTKTGDVTELRRIVRQRVEMMKAMRERMTNPPPEKK
ncbi:MAG TPA: hypothetical protein VKY31_10690 [Terriglobia bacterium]|nr:hypothetical protein [Terriglobia bacterium]